MAPPPSALVEHEAVEAYLAGCSATTATCYRRDLDHLAAHLARAGTDLLGATRAELARWVRAQEATGVPATTIRRRISAVVGCYGALVHTGILAISPAEGLRRPRGGPAPRLGLDAADLRRLLESARAEGRDTELLVCLLFVEGLRVAEACAIETKDLMSHEGRRGLLVRRKGGRVEIVGLADQVADLAWELAASKGPGPLLRAERGGRLCRQVAWRQIRRLAERAGIDVPVYPHLLRHSHVSQALLAGVPLAVVQASAGHRDIRSTLGYAQALGSMGGLAAPVLVDRVITGT